MSTTDTPLELKHTFRLGWTLKLAEGALKALDQGNPEQARVLLQAALNTDLDRERRFLAWVPGLKVTE